MPGQAFCEGVILAAGASSRIGMFKPALPIGDTTMIGHCIQGMSEVCQRIIVVGGNEFGKLRLLVEGLANIECVENSSYQKGMFTSVKTGLSRVHGDRCFVLPADVPLVPRRVYRHMLTVDKDVIVPAFHGRHGHPVCLSKAILPRILSEPDESIFRDILRSIGVHALDVDAEEILMDVDTSEDYDLIRQRWSLLQ